MKNMEPVAKFNYFFVLLPCNQHLKQMPQNVKIRCRNNRGDRREPATQDRAQSHVGYALIVPQTRLSADYDHCRGYHSSRSHDFGISDNTIVLSI